MSTATILYEFETGRGNAAVVHLNPPLKESDEDTCYACGQHVAPKVHEYVVSSAVELDYGPETSRLFRDAPGSETYLFPANASAVLDESQDYNQLIKSWGELPGSTKNTLDHHVALTAAGYDTITYVGASS